MRQFGPELFAPDTLKSVNLAIERANAKDVVSHDYTFDFEIDFENAEHVIR